MSIFHHPEPKVKLTIKQQNKLKAAGRLERATGDLRRAKFAYDSAVNEFNNATELLTQLHLQDTYREAVSLDS